MFVNKTTKYYKEVSSETTITPKYKCYKHRTSPTAMYAYYNVVDGKIYITSYYNPIMTTNENELSEWIGDFTINEDTFFVSDGFFQNVPYDRYTTGDFGSYTTTTTTVIPGTPDDYTYTESQTKTYTITKQYAKHRVGEFNSYSYGVTGSPTVSADGLASGFSTANYLTTPKFPTSVTNLETVWKVKFSSLSTTQYFYNTAPYYSLLLGMNGSKFRFWLSNNTTNWDISSGATGTTTLTTNTWYYVKFTYDGSAYKLYMSTDNSTWTLEASLSSTKTIGVNYATGRIGHGWTDNPANNTTIDLKESYIKIDNVYWWSGFYSEDVIGDKSYLILKEYIKHKKGEFNPNTYTKVGSPTIKEYTGLPGYRLYTPSFIVNDSYYCIDESMQDKRVYLWNKNCTSPEHLTIAYDSYLYCDEDILSVIGPNLTINEYKRYRAGVVSGFSTSNFLKFTESFTPSSNPWEMVFKVTTGNNLTVAQYIVAFGKGFTYETRYATRIGIHEDKNFVISVSYNGTAWDIVGGTTAGAKGSHTVLANTTYYLKFEFTGSAYKLSYSLNGVEYIQDCYVASTTPMYNANTANLIGVWYQNSYTSPFLGSIDLSQSYIKINGKYWWAGFYIENVYGEKYY